MNEPILKAVAMPPRIFWAPMVPAALNLGIQSALIFFGIALFNLNPLVIVLTTVFPTHIALVALGAREPHLSKMMQSQGPFIKNYKNMYPEKGKKLAP